MLWFGCTQKADRGVSQARQEAGSAEAVVEITLTAHESLEIECPQSKERLRGSFPAGVNAPMQYGDKLKALVVSFHTVGAVSTNRIHELFGKVFEIPLSAGTVLQMVHQCAAKVEPVMDSVRDKIAAGALYSRTINFASRSVDADGKTGNFLCSRV